MEEQRGGEGREEETELTRGAQGLPPDLENLAEWRKETEWVSSPTGGTYTVCQVKAGNGL